MNFADVLLPIAPLQPCPRQPLPPAQSGPTSQQGFFSFFISTYYFVIHVVSTCPLALSHQLIFLFPPLCSSLVDFLIRFPLLISFVSLLQSPSSANQRKTSFPHSLSFFPFPCPFCTCYYRALDINLTNTKQTAGVARWTGRGQQKRTIVCVRVCVTSDKY